MELLKLYAVSEDMINELNDLVIWNTNHYLHPLDDFNDDWMKENAIINSEELYSLATQIFRELGENHAYLICRVLADYGITYTFLALAEYYEEHNRVVEAIKYYEKCLFDSDACEIAKEKLSKLKRIFYMDN